MTDIERKARELLAAELEAMGDQSIAIKLRRGDAGMDYSFVAAIRAIVAALRAAPDGYVLVPVEPTDEMCAAASARIKEVTVVIDAGPAKGATLVRDPYYHAYKAMLAARAQGVQL